MNLRQKNRKLLHPTDITRLDTRCEVVRLELKVARLKPVRPYKIVLLEVKSVKSGPVETRQIFPVATALYYQNVLSL